MRSQHRMLAFQALLLLSTSLGGCASTLSVQPIAAASVEAVEAHRGTVVLFQIKASLDGRPLSLAKPEYDTGFDNVFRFYAAGLDALEAPRRVHPVSPSEAASAEGWHYLVLPSGVHFLLVLPPGSEQAQVVYDASSAKFGRITDNTLSRGPTAPPPMSPQIRAFVWPLQTPPPGYRELPGFWFEVPENRTAVYLGSLSIACRTQRGLLGPLFGPCDDFEWSSDPQSAQRVLASYLPRSTVDPLHLTVNGKPLPGTPLRGLEAVDLVVRRPDAIAATFVSSDALLSFVSSWQLADLPLWVLFYPLDAAMRHGAKVSAEQRIAAAQPCSERLSEMIRTVDYSAPFVEAMGSAARSSGTEIAVDSDRRAGSRPAMGPALYRLTVSWPILRLQEVSDGQQAVLELAMQARLEALETKSTRYFRVIHYGHSGFLNPLAPGSTILYSQFLSERPKPRPMSDWCGPEGGSLVRDEISAVLQKMAAQVARDLE